VNRAGYDAPVKRFLFGLLLASGLSCSSEVNPPWSGCDPACARWETCVRGYCVRTSEPPISNPCGAGSCSDAATDASADASGG